MHQGELIPLGNESLRTAPISHDRLFKELFKAFYLLLMQMFCPDWARRIKPGVRFLDKEILPQQPRAEGEADLLAVVQELPEEPLLPGLAEGLSLPEVLVHTEIQEGRSEKPIEERVYHYNHDFHLEYGLPTQSLLCWFGRGSGGVKDVVYERRALGEWTVRFRFRRVGIRGLSAAEYLSGSNPLGYALAARMDPGGLRPADLRARCEGRIARAQGLTARQRHLLVNCVRTYVVLSREEQVRYEALREHDEEVKQMELTWDEQMWYAAEKRGMADSIREYWELRFGDMTAQQRERLMAIADRELLSRIRRGIYQAQSLTEAESALTAR